MFERSENIAIPCSLSLLVLSMHLPAVRGVVYMPICIDLHMCICILYVLTAAVMQGTDQELQALRILRSKPEIDEPELGCFMY